jgi:hypothetical protein
MGDFWAHVVTGMVYTSVLLPFLLTPAIWAWMGSIPRHPMRAFFVRDAMAMVETNQHTSVLGIL